ncbi:MAG: DUF1998 domain-containing protein [Anaerolineae bacterium]|nr:DUF1998 domain-containing protein [Anaerolineae bacterium]
MAAERIGREAQRTILLSEIAEGGSGVLRRLVEEPNALAEVARAALERIHYNAAGDDQRPECIAACHECSMSYNNQREILSRDRRRMLPTLPALARRRTLPRVGGRSGEEHLVWLRSLTDARSELERRFLETLVAGGYRLPKDAQREIAEPHCVVDFFYHPTCVSSAIARCTTNRCSARRM